MPRSWPSLLRTPVGNLISVPFQNNTNFSVGPEERRQNILNIQPVISQPAPLDDRTNGIGDTVFTAFLSPAKPGKWIWGAGPFVKLPTNNDKYLSAGLQ